MWSGRPSNQTNKMPRYCCHLQLAAICSPSNALFNDASLATSASIRHTKSTYASNIPFFIDANYVPKRFVRVVWETKQPIEQNAQAPLFNDAGVRPGCTNNQWLTERFVRVVWKTKQPHETKRHANGTYSGAIRQTIRFRKSSCQALFGLSPTEESYSTENSFGRI